MEVKSWGVTLRVLCIDDDTRLYELLAKYLGENGVRLEHAPDGRKGLDALDRGVFDAVLLDVMMPGMDGLEVCKRIRDKSRVPVIMLTAKGDETDRVVGLELGADDYVTKPFSSAELVSRIRSLMRRRAIDLGDQRQVQSVGGVVLDLARHRVEVDGATVQLTPTEFRLVSLLASDPERVFSREEIMRHLWQSAFVGDTRNVDVHVRNVRRKIERDPPQPERLVTVRGVGYQLRPV